MFTQQTQVCYVIGVVDEAALAIMAALDEVQGDAWQYQALSLIHI